MPERRTVHGGRVERLRKRRRAARKTHIRTPETRGPIRSGKARVTFHPTARFGDFGSTGVSSLLMLCTVRM